MSKSKTILRNILCCSLSLILICGYLESLEKSIEYYSGNNLPSYLSQAKSQGDQTVICIKGWARNASVTISEKRENDKGKIFAQDLKPNNGEVVFALSSLGYYPGEIVTCSFTDRKSGKSEEIKIVPHRIFTKSTEDGAEIEVKILHLLSGTFMIDFKGFDKDEELGYISKSYDEIMDINIKPMSIFYMPAVVNKRGGVAEIQIKRATGEILTLQVPWGAELLKYVLINNHDGTHTRLIDTPEYRQEYPGIVEYFDSQKVGS